jgi:delta-aminolevulinic acid dehydratase/porphobilinogen synthase
LRPLLRKQKVLDVLLGAYQVSGEYSMRETAGPL